MDKQLLRSRADSMIAGVCGGLGDYLGVDSTLIRLGWVLLALVSVGFGIVVYLVAWFLIPDEDGRRAPLPVLLLLVFVVLPGMCGLCCSLMSLVIGIGAPFLGG
jgi:phage shock protein PspC (stress-responsive transcriptional regulator)